MANYARIEAGAADSWADYSFEHPVSRRVTPGKHFLKQELGLTGMEVSLNRLAPGQGMPFLHRHRLNEELYLFLSGQGEFQVDGEVFPARAGSAVRVSPAGARSWRNTGTEPMTYVVVQARADSMSAGTVADGERAEGQLSWPGT